MPVSEVKSKAVTSAAGSTVISTIMIVNRRRPMVSSTRWPTNQKKARVSSTQKRFGGLAIGQVMSRHRSPSRTHGATKGKFMNAPLAPSIA